MGRGGVEVLLDAVEAAGDQLQAVRRGGAGGIGLVDDAVGGVLVVGVPDTVTVALCEEACRPKGSDATIW